MSDSTSLAGMARAARNTADAVAIASAQFRRHLQSPLRDIPHEQSGGTLSSDCLVRVRTS
jgi:hypothetical protein